ncbi:GH22566 [Drosophila grimshawi]|uniref:GH22566 n=2 Tax=Drosophila grimshawi TaxID=7222 RepID=B4JVT8_DROGR|nr:GH22914 [Drosophila grimshawi]EDW04928.1 GH22566 [Drosophila grimshawi]
MEKLLLLLLLVLDNPGFIETNLLPDYYWPNGSQSVQEDDNVTSYSNDYEINSDTNENSSILMSMDLRMKIAFFALMIHIVIVGGGIIIYSFVYCKSWSNNRRLVKETKELKRRLQNPLAVQHLTNTPNCPCHGCRVARQMLNGLIVQQIITERSER